MSSHDPCDSRCSLTKQRAAEYLWALRQHPPWIANCHLCALDTWPELPRLKASARGGCHVCALISDLIKVRNVKPTPSPSDAHSIEVGVWIDFRYVPREKNASAHGPLRNVLDRADVFLSTSAWWQTIVWWLTAESTDGRSHLVTTTSVR